MVQGALAVRNALVHGFEAIGLNQMAEELVQLAHRLVVELGQHVA